MTQLAAMVRGTGVTVSPARSLARSKSSPARIASASACNAALRSAARGAAGHDVEPKPTKSTPEADRDGAEEDLDDGAFSIDKLARNVSFKKQKKPRLAKDAKILLTQWVWIADLLANVPANSAPGLTVLCRRLKITSIIRTRRKSRRYACWGGGSAGQFSHTWRRPAPTHVDTQCVSTYLMVSAFLHHKHHATPQERLSYETGITGSQVAHFMINYRSRNWGQAKVIRADVGGRPHKPAPAKLPPAATDVLTGKSNVASPHSSSRVFHRMDGQAQHITIPVEQ